MMQPTVTIVSCFAKIAICSTTRPCRSTSVGAVIAKARHIDAQNAASPPQAPAPGSDRALSVLS